MKKHGALAALGIVLVLASCAAPAPTPTPTPSATATGVRPTPKPTPTATLPPLAIPQCDELLPLATAKQMFSKNVELFGQTPAGEFVARIPVPSIPVVLSTADPARACRWAVPNSDGVFSLVVAGITAAERATLQAELTAEGFTETTSGELTAFELAQPDLGPGGHGTTHVFSRELWIISDNTALAVARPFAAAALEALRAENPALDL